MYRYVSPNSNLNNLIEYIFHSVALHVWQLPYLQNMWPKLHMVQKIKQDRQQQRDQSKILEEK